MSIYSEQYAKYGKTCKWLECDSWCHFTKCLLNQAKLNKLYERFKELNVKFPNVYSEVFSDTCSGGEYNCFEKEPKPIQNWDQFNEDDETELEKEADRVADDFLKDDDFVMQLYREAKRNYISRKMEEIADLEKTLSEMEKED